MTYPDRSLGLPNNVWAEGTVAVPGTDQQTANPGDYHGSDLLAEQNARLDEVVKAALAHKIEAVSSHELPPSSGYFAVQLNNTLARILEEQGYDPTLTNIAAPNKKNTVTQGVDLACNVAGMARAAGVAPLDAAARLAEVLSAEDVIHGTTTAGSFVNMALDYKQVAPRVLAEVAAYGDDYGSFRDGVPEVVIIDYSSPNVAKNMTVAHLRSTIIGHVLTKIQEAAGNIPFGVNHLGDWGTQFGNIIYQYKQELTERGAAFTAELDADPTATLMAIYRKFNEAKTEHPESVIAARAIFHQLEQGDPELVGLWAQFREWSLRDFGPSYSRLGIEFDAIQGESFYEGRMPQAVTEAVAAGVLVVDESGATVFPAQPLTNPTTGAVNDRIMLGKDGQPSPELVVKPNGGTVYLTRDLAAVRYRTVELCGNRILYVIGKEQEAHCLKLFAIAEKLGLVAMGNAQHVSFGHLNIGGRKMKTREGKVVLLNDVLDESVAAATSMIKERVASSRGIATEEVVLTEADLEVARKIGISTIIFNDLRQDRVKDIEFNANAASTIEAGGATYIQYTNTRLNSILAKVNGDPLSVTEMPAVLSAEETDLVAQIAQLPIVVRDAAETSAPHKLATYLTNFCQTVNVFYRERSILNAELPAERAFRLALVVAAKQVINNTAQLLHLELPEKM